MNLVVIVSDTFRCDYLGAYGNEWIRTPHLDALAAESALFLDAYGEGLPTINARRVIMTGRNISPSSTARSIPTPSSSTVGIPSTTRTSRSPSTCGSEATSRRFSTTSTT